MLSISIEVYFVLLCHIQSLQNPVLCTGVYPIFHKSTHIKITIATWTDNNLVYYWSCKKQVDITRQNSDPYFLSIMVLPPHLVWWSGWILTTKNDYIGYNPRGRYITILIELDYLIKTRGGVIFHLIYYENILRWWRIDHIYITLLPLTWSQIIIGLFLVW